MLQTKTIPFFSLQPIAQARTDLRQKKTTFWKALNHFIAQLYKKKHTIRKVAVCGGSGSEYFHEAIAKNCDAYITADIKYHTFQDAGDEILLVDAGHYETEIFCLDEIKKRIDFQLNPNKDIKIYLYSGSTNPVIFYNN